MCKGNSNKFLWYGLLLLPLFLLPCGALAQRGAFYRTDFKNKSYIDTMATMVWTGVNVGYQLPFGDLGKTFLGNFNVGTGITAKTKHNWTFDINFNYMFGSNLKDKSFAFLGDMVNSNSIISDGNGMKATIYTEGRYWQAGAGAGKVIPVNRWKNSGIWLHWGAGFFRHKIRINDFDYQVPQLDGDYLKGYDHRSSGFGMSQFIGYLFIQKNRILNLYAGIELMEFWTKPDRNYIFLEGPTENMPYKFSGLVGLKIGWNIPLYEKKAVTTFYYR